MFEEAVRVPAGITDVRNLPGDNFVFPDIVLGNKKLKINLFLPEHLFFDYDVAKNIRWAKWEFKTASPKMIEWVLCLRDKGETIKWDYIERDYGVLEASMRFSF